MFAKGSEPWILTAVFISAILAGFHSLTKSSSFLHGTYVSIGIALFMVLFFRDPERNVNISEKHMVSPADGTVIDIRGRKICIFMFFQNVHVNRAPIRGKIKSITYKKGSYIPAFCKDSERNERNVFVIESKYGDVIVTQIAGTIARRIVTYSKVKDIVEQGQRIGMIRLGSRVDVTVPEGFDMLVKPGDRVLAGKTIIARIHGAQAEGQDEAQEAYI